MERMSDDVSRQGQVQGQDADDDSGDDPRIVVVTPDGMGVSVGSNGGGSPDEGRDPDDRDGYERPRERTNPADLIEELKDGLAPELVAELDRIALPFRDDSPSDAELRIAQAQLVGWLEGLFHGIQTALVAQQMAAQAQLQQMRQLPPGTSHQGMPSPGGPGMPQSQPPMGGPGHAEGTGQYL